MVRGFVLVLVLTLAACGSRSLKKAGDPCAASSECDPGLLCDLSQTPAVCAGQGSAPQDGAAPTADAPVADAGVDAPVDAPADAAVDAPDAM